jgi:hypothetical protein
MSIDERGYLFLLSSYDTMTNVLMYCSTPWANPADCLISLADFWYVLIALSFIPMIHLRGLACAYFLLYLHETHSITNAATHAPHMLAFVSSRRDLNLLESTWSSGWSVSLIILMQVDSHRLQDPLLPSCFVPSPEQDCQHSRRVDSQSLSLHRIKIESSLAVIASNLWDILFLTVARGRSRFTQYPSCCCTSIPYVPEIKPFRAQSCLVDSDVIRLCFSQANPDRSHDLVLAWRSCWFRLWRSDSAGNRQPGLTFLEAVVRLTWRPIASPPGIRRAPSGVLMRQWASHNSLYLIWIWLCFLFPSFT